MPGLIEEQGPQFKTITVKELHPTFAAEVGGVNFQVLSDEQFAEILVAMAKYGVCVFRSTGLDDASHIEFSRRFGNLDNIGRFLTGGRKARYEHLELFDAGNLEDDGSVASSESLKGHLALGNTLFHVDSSFNPRRASFCLLRAVELPPPGNGGNTDFLDSRTAYSELPQDLRDEVESHDYIGAHTILQSRKLGSPEYFRNLDPGASQMYRHRIAQRHEPSGRQSLYIASHMHHIEEKNSIGTPIAQSAALTDKLMNHVAQEKYMVSVTWEQPGDLIIWDNRCVMHRAGRGSFEGRYKRDMRRTTVHDDSPTAWGLNSADSEWQGLKLSSTRTA